MSAVHIVTGEVNAGRTARMRELYRQTAAADGILSEKRFSGEGCCGYHLVHLRSGKELYITVRTGCLQAFVQTYGIARYQLIPVPQSA